jgi:glycosyltransferase involved in cell wall biosynthesis
MPGNNCPAVSVIIPCYKVTAYIAEALDSVRRQTFRDLEVIVVNDGCPDTVNLERVLAPYSREIVYIKQENMGCGNARNTGIRAARAPILAFLDGDDVWEPGYLDFQSSILKERPDIDLVYSNAVQFGASGEGSLIMDRFPSRGEVTLRSLLNQECQVFGLLVARREIIARAGYYDPVVKIAEDLDMWLRVVKVGGRFAYHDKPLYRYRLRPGSITTEKIHLIRAVISVLEMRRESLAVSPREREWFDEAISRERAKLDFLLGRRAVYTGNRVEALQYLSRARRVIKRRKLGVTVAALKLAPRLLFRYVRYRYPTEQAFVSGVE